MRGLGAPLRMMGHYHGLIEGENVEYVCFDAGSPEAENYKEEWFGVKEKIYTPQNVMMNLPWVKVRVHE